MNNRWRDNLIVPPPNWANSGPRKETPMADPLSQLIDACRLLSHVAKETQTAAPTIRLASYEEALRFKAALSKTDTAAMLFTGPIETLEDFEIHGIKITWPQPL